MGLTAPSTLPFHHAYAYESKSGGGNEFSLLLVGEVWDGWGIKRNMFRLLRSCREALRSAYRDFRWDGEFFSGRLNRFSVLKERFS